MTKFYGLPRSVKKLIPCQNKNLQATSLIVINGRLLPSKLPTFCRWQKKALALRRRFLPLVTCIRGAETTDDWARTATSSNHRPSVRSSCPLRPIIIASGAMPNGSHVTVETATIAVIATARRLWCRNRISGSCDIGSYTTATHCHSGPYMNVIPVVVT